MIRRFYIVIIFILTASTQSVMAKDSSQTLPQKYRSSHHAGIRLGVWSNKGESPPAISIDSTLLSNMKDNNFFFEGYYGYRLTASLMVEGSVGLVNRGSVTFKEFDTDKIGNVLLYSMLIQGKIYPLGSSSLRLQPYIMAGGGLYYGKRSVQFTSNYYYYNNVGEESDTDFRYTVGGGFDYPIASMLALDFSIKYMAIDFSDKLITISNYEGLAISVGLQYFWSGTKKTK